jgi:syntaxin 5
LNNREVPFIVLLFSDIILVMTDRTQEFQAVLQAVSHSSGKAHQKSSLEKKLKDDQLPGRNHLNKKSTAFNEVASDIAKGVYKTSSLLTQLTSLVRKQGLFDDPTDQINTLIFRIKQDLDELNNKCDKVSQTFVESNKSVFGDYSTQSSQHNNKVVSQLKNDLLSTTKDFKTILELRSNKMKDSQQRKIELTGKSMLSPTKLLEENNNNNNASKNRLPPPPPPSSSSDTIQGNSFLNSSSSASASAMSNNLGITKRKSSLINPYAMVLDQEVGNSGNGMAVGQRDEHRMQQHLLLEPLSTDNQYYESRETAVTEVEKTIGELGQLFKRLATMIQSQQELVERIDDDVENALSNTENAKNALLKAYENISSNRGMYMKIGAILVVFFLIFVLFLL